MTVREAIVNTLFPISAPDMAIDLALQNAGLNGAAVYNSSMQGDVEKAAVSLLYSVSLVTSEREGEYQITYDKNAILNKIAYLSGKNGIAVQSGQPLIQDVSGLW